MQEYGCAAGFCDVLQFAMVLTDALAGFCRLTGLKSNGIWNSSGTPARTVIMVTAMTAMRCRCRKSSSGARAAKPTEAGSPGGFNAASIAGTKVMLHMNAISMPHPAISPSSERPS